MQSGVIWVNWVIRKKKEQIPLWHYEIIEKIKYDYSLNIFYDMSTEHVKNNVNKCAFKQKQIKE